MKKEFVLSDKYTQWFCFYEYLCECTLKGQCLTLLVIDTKNGELHQIDATPEDVSHVKHRVTLRVINSQQRITIPFKGANPCKFNMEVM